MRTTHILAALLGLGLSTMAAAAWNTEIEDDVFSGGKKASLIGELDPYHALVFDCDSEKLQLSLLEKSTTKFNRGDLNVNLVVKADQSPVRRFNAVTSQRNEKYWQVATNSREDILVLLGDLRAASSKVLVGIQFEGSDSKWSGMASSVGSTNAVDRFMKSCNLK